MSGGLESCSTSQTVTLTSCLSTSAARSATRVRFGPTEELPSGWTDVYTHRFAEPGFNERWQCGEIPTATLIEHFARELDVDVDVVDGYVRRLCRSVSLRSGILASVWARRLRAEPQALVTVNPDIFDEIVRYHALSDLFDQVVVSALEGTSDKMELCRIALDRLGRREDFGSAILIDDNAEHVTAFERAGGSGYLFVDDQTFQADLAAGRLPSCLSQ